MKVEAQWSSVAAVKAGMFVISQAPQVAGSYLQSRCSHVQPTFRSGLKGRETQPKMTTAQVNDILNISMH